MKKIALLKIAVVTVAVSIGIFAQYHESKQKKNRTEKKTVVKHQSSFIAQEISY